MNGSTISGPEDRYDSNTPDVPARRKRRRQLCTYATIEEDGGGTRRELLIDETVQVGDRVEKSDEEVTFHKVGP